VAAGIGLPSVTARKIGVTRVLGGWGPKVVIFGDGEVFGSLIFTVPPDRVEPVILHVFKAKLSKVLAAIDCRRRLRLNAGWNGVPVTV